VTALSNHYNVRMKFQTALAVVMLSAGLFAQSAPPPCPADRPVDDIITEVHKQQSKKKNRTTNPFPNVTCIFGWCRDHSNTPNTNPEPAPQADASHTDRQSSSTDSSSKSSTAASVNQCDIATEQALEAAHSVDVGDFNFKAGNYQGALMRYRDAANQKPSDIAIHVRLGRALEKLNEQQQAIDEYDAALKLAGPEKWTQEAKAALSRLQNNPHS